MRQGQTVYVFVLTGACAKEIFSRKIYCGGHVQIYTHIYAARSYTWDERRDAIPLLAGGGNEWLARIREKFAEVSTPTYSDFLFATFPFIFLSSSRLKFLPQRSSPRCRDYKGRLSLPHRRRVKWCQVRNNRACRFTWSVLYARGREIRRISDKIISFLFFRDL